MFDFMKRKKVVAKPGQATGEISPVSVFERAKQITAVNRKRDAVMDEIDEDLGTRKKKKK